MNLGRELARLCVGIDHLYRRASTGQGVLDREGLIPVALAEIDPMPLADWPAAERTLDELDRQLPGVSEGLRRAYLAEMIDSLRALLGTFQHAKLSYAERVRRCLRVPAKPVADDVLTAYCAVIAGCLKELGYAGADLAAELVAWERAERVPDADVLPTLARLLQLARSRTESMLFALPDGMLEPVGVRNVPFAAYCDYPNRRLLLNLDYGYTQPALKHLACHEGFPGHFVQLATRAALVAQGEMPLDGALVITSSASSPLFEGIAENGIFFLDWIDGPADRLAVTLNRLRAAARINAAWQIHAEARPHQEVCHYLERTCFQSRAWAESRLAFLTHPLRAPFIFAYWYGDMAVERVWQRVLPSQRGKFWHYLYANMHTPATLDAFWVADRETD